MNRRRGTSEGGREKILRAALGCFSRDGVAGTPLGRLLSESGVSAGSFYHHFTGKEEVAAVLYAETLRGYQEGFLRELRRHADPQAAVAACVAFHIDWCRRHPDHARFLFTERPPGRQEPGGRELADYNRAFYTDVLAWWRQHEHHGALRPLDIVTAYVLWLGPAQELCRQWLTGRAPEPSPDQIALLGEAAWQALRQPDSRPSQKGSRT
ncbi:MULTISPECIES: TetR/AcrR family transcriptional regulator [Thermomonospora]|uniref:Transcriptional regulator, TetR family n=1 Tax=Thermomonospora curvata (strain ATCC 19995 / DSM 43183 / JCM 3096 / KCTC 9072 / NBRC 15933 / NCIMB 10081 / Henssen B9) TaxID=471852 RepID=D1A1L1_THECD|nr:MULTISPECIES: TetR/AcrR family transcriptional regulator [Thermomonospora]ACY95933.1 transcriptional regulator, TetR family [Thermomonospora curvata DSM 43183]PKK16177.1 MAG: TetR/AcrR family transcriptional regulator [Thermomonospora sp. CIF 1]